MDASLQTRAEELATDISRQAKTAEEFNSLMRLMMKSALERMLDTEMDVHLGRRSAVASDPPAAERETVAPSAKPARGTPNRRNGRSRKSLTTACTASG